MQISDQLLGMYFLFFFCFFFLLNHEELKIKLEQKEKENIEEHLGIARVRH